MQAGKPYLKKIYFQSEYIRIRSLSLAKTTTIYIYFIQMQNQKAKKISKPISGRWTKSEHERFLNALEKYGKDWVKVQKVIKTRTLTQVRSHAQKVFLKMSQADIEALIGQDVDFEDSLDKHQETNIVGYQSNSRTEHLLESFKKHLQQNQQKNLMIPESKQEIQEERQFLPLKQSLAHHANQLESSYFLRVLADNYDHFQSGKTFMDLTETLPQDPNVSFIPFNSSLPPRHFETINQQ